LGIGTKVPAYAYQLPRRVVDRHLRGASGQAVHTDLLIKIFKSAQRMTVTVNGQQLYE
jgi:hypothetical protein